MGCASAVGNYCPASSKAVVLEPKGKVTPTNRRMVNDSGHQPYARIPGLCDRVLHVGVI